MSNDATPGSLGGPKGIYEAPARRHLLFDYSQEQPIVSDFFMNLITAIPQDVVRLPFGQG